MRRKKKPLTRRRRAARCAAAALVLLLLAQNLLHTALLLPIQAVRLREKRDGVQDARVIRRQWEPKSHNWTALFYLTASDNAVLLTETYLSAQGWRPAYSPLLDCTEARPLHAGEWTITRAEDENRYFDTHLFFYGRVDDPAIETVEIRLQVPPDYEAAEEEAVESGYLLLTAPIFQQEGRRYFLLEHRAPALESAKRADRIVGRNAAGDGVTSFQIGMTSAGGT